MKIRGWTIIETLVSMLIISIIILLFSQVTRSLYLDNDYSNISLAKSVINEDLSFSEGENNWYESKIDTADIKIEKLIENIEGSGLLKVSYEVFNQYDQRIYQCKFIRDED